MDALKKAIKLQNLAVLKKINASKGSPVSELVLKMYIAEGRSINEISSEIAKLSKRNAKNKSALSTILGRIGNAFSRFWGKR